MIAAAAWPALRTVTGIVALACAVAIASGCRSMPMPPAGTIGAQPLGRPVPRWTDAQWRDASARAWQAALDDARRGGALDGDAAAAHRARAIVQRLVAAAGAMGADRLASPWPTHVARADAPDAWCLPEVGCIVASALVAIAGDDDELAAALAHAVAHALLGHVREGAEALHAEQAGSPGGRDANAAARPADATDAAPMIDRVVKRLPWRRAQEVEADRLGVELAARAGFDPRGAVSFWRRALTVPAAGGAQGWTVRHPAPDNRAAELSRFAQRALPLYEGTRGIIRSP